MIGGRHASRDRIAGGVKKKSIYYTCLDSVPEAVPAPEHGGVRGEKVSSVSEYGEQVAVGDVVAEGGPNARSCGGQVLDKRENGLG